LFRAFVDAEDGEAEDGLPKSRYEVLAEQRDYKRRRQSYRAKNVHITKRSAVEVSVNNSLLSSHSRFILGYLGNPINFGFIF